MMRVVATSGLSWLKEYIRGQKLLLEGSRAKLIYKYSPQIMKLQKRGTTLTFNPSSVTQAAPVSTCPSNTFLENNLCGRSLDK